MNRLYVGERLSQKDISAYGGIRKIIKADRFPRGFGYGRQRFKLFNYSNVNGKIKKRAVCFENNTPWYMPLTDEEVQFGLIIGAIARVGNSMHENFFYLTNLNGYDGVQINISSIRSFVSK